MIAGIDRSAKINRLDWTPPAPDIAADAPKPFRIAMPLARPVPRRLPAPQHSLAALAPGLGLAAALALGAEGINMGTRFCATQEAPAHPAIKDFLVANDERDTRLIFRSLRNSARVARNGVAEETVARLSVPGAGFETVAELVSGKRGREALVSGDVEGGIIWAGQAQGLIHDVPTCAELIARIVAEAEEIIAARLARMRA